MIHDINTHMNSDYFKQIRREMLNDVEPKACTRCYEEERKGIESKRVYESKVYKDFDTRYASRLTSEDGSISLDPSFVQLRPGNVCNVLVPLVIPQVVPRWVKDYKEIVDL